ncbi:hypothetical protein H0H93_006138 [Arthromyces matolae]|nr:hypothetical protein H0H93_006138 [Arthromyces matolae]
MLRVPLRPLPARHFSSTLLRRNSSIPAKPSAEQNDPNSLNTPETASSSTSTSSLPDLEEPRPVKDTSQTQLPALSPLHEHLDEFKRRMRVWRDQAAVTFRNQADEFTAKSKKSFSQLGAELNKMTGYELIDALKREVVEQETRINQTRQASREAKKAYDDAVARRSNSQREVNDLHQRRSTWTDADVGRFTTLVMQDHLYEQEEARARARAHEMEDAVEREFSELMRTILARYHEEQVWSDKIRSASTYGSLAALGLNMLIFVLAIVAVEPWKRRRLAQTFEAKLEGLSRENEARLSASMTEIGAQLADQERLILHLRDISHSVLTAKAAEEKVERDVADIKDEQPRILSEFKATSRVELSKEMAAVAAGAFLVGIDWADSSSPFSIKHLFDVYVKVNKDAESNPEVKVEAAKWFKRMEDGDESALKNWRVWRELSVKKYEEQYDRLNVHFDVYNGESMVGKEWQDKALDRLNEMGLISDADGAKIVDLQKWKLGSAVVRKKDGSSIYLTRDIGGAIERYEKYKFDKMIYVVSSQQDLHLAQFFKVLELMDFPWAKNLQHVNYGLVQGMSTRKGTVVFLDQIIKEAADVMYNQMKQNEEKFAAVEDPETVAREIGITGVKIQDMAAKRINNYTFDWARMLSFEGDTGPYLQYAHVRLASIGRKNPQLLPLPTPDLIKTDTLAEMPHARDIVFLLGTYPDVIKTALRTHEASGIVTFAFRLSHAISSAWETVIVKGEEDTEKARARMFISEPNSDYAYAMTSFIIKDHLRRPQAPSWTPDTDSNCTFCRIISNELPAYRVYEDDEIVAILDILPLRRGHTLVIPKVHCARLSELPAEYAAATGKAVSSVANALTKGQIALDNTALNVVCNQEYAQAVPHVHFHIIPAPTFGPSEPVESLDETSPNPPTMREMHRLEYESRNELDEDDAGVLTREIRLVKGPRAFDRRKNKQT